MPAWRGTRAELTDAIRRLPAVLSGEAPDPHGLGAILLKEVGTEAMRLIQDAFRVKSAGGTGSDGITWAELKESTLERRRRKGIAHDRILEEWGELLYSLTPGEPGLIEGQVFDIEPGRVTVGSADPKADKHQFGAGRVPARPIVTDDMPPAWERPLQEAFARGMEKVLEAMIEAGGVG